jgi:hypothetical protein
MMTWILRQDGTPDYKAMTEEARQAPLPLSIAEQKQHLLAHTAKERALVNELVRTGGLEALQRERDAADNSFRRQQEEEGRRRQAAEAAAIANRLEELRLQQEAAVESALEVDPETGEKCTNQEIVLRNHQRAMKRIADRAAAPIHMTESELQAAHQRKTELQGRFDAAKAESLRPKVAGEKF